VITVDVIDYGAGNLASVRRALLAVGATPRVVSTVDDITTSSALLIPGVGHFNATRSLTPDWHRAVRARIADGAAVLGICLGMQWLFEGSEEAPDVPGLGVFSGRCFRLDGNIVKVPHVGWNSLERTAAPSRLLADSTHGAYAYFTHTFAAPVSGATVATTTHAATFASVVEDGRVFGAQWHPEKSSDLGLGLLRRFADIANGGQPC
jgi:glutamine amidotransferase